MRKVEILKIVEKQIFICFACLYQRNSNSFEVFESIKSTSNMIKYFI